MNLAFDPSADGPANMAADLALLSAAEEGTASARLYSWDGLWVTLGRFQTAPDALLRDVPYVIRPTGGRAVLHGHDLTLAIAIPRPSCSVKDLYCELVRPMIAALSACGMDARMACDTPQGGTGKVSADCFAFSSPNDVVDFRTGLKVAGCAMRITERGALLQASIPYNQPLARVSEVIAGGIDLPLIEWDWERFGRALAERLLPNGT